MSASSRAESPVDDAGAVYMTGHVLPCGFNCGNAGPRAQSDSNGVLVWSTQIGLTDTDPYYWGEGIAVNSSGVYVAGNNPTHRAS